jgi:hypothetical protein
MQTPLARALCTFSLLCCLGAAHATHARDTTTLDPIHLELGAQPKALSLLGAGEAPRVLRMPGGETIAANTTRAILTIDTSRASTPGDGSDDTMLSRSVQRVEFVLEPQGRDDESPELAVYRLVIVQAALDERLLPGLDLGSGSDVSTAVADAISMPIAHQAPTPESGVTRTIVPTMGVNARVTIAPQGWVHSVTFSYPDDATSEAFTLMQDITSALRTLLAPVPQEGVGEGARWTFDQYDGIDGLLVGVTRTITLDKAPPEGQYEQLGSLRLSQTFSCDTDEDLKAPATLAFTDSDVQSVRASLEGNAQMLFDYAADASPLPKDASSLTLRRSEATWRKPDDADSPTFTAGSVERRSTILRIATEPLDAFAEPPADEGIEAIVLEGERWKRVEVGAAQNFEGAQRGVEFAAQRLRDLLISGQPAPENTLGEGQPVPLGIELRVGEPQRASVQYERVSQMQSSLPTIDSIRAYSLRATVELVLEELHDMDMQATGYVLVSAVSGNESVAKPRLGQDIEAQDVSHAAFGEDVTIDLAGVRIPCVAFAAGGVSLRVHDVPQEVSESWQAQTSEVLFALEDALLTMQPTRHASELREGEVRVTTSGKPDDENVAGLTLVALAAHNDRERGPVRVLREFQYLREASRENDLFSVTPFLKDAKVNVSSRWEGAAELSGLSVPTRATRTQSTVRDATYAVDGNARTGKETILQFMRVQKLP